MTVTQSVVRLAHPSEEAHILELIRVMHAESGWRKLDIERCRLFLARAFARQGGILGVIGAPGQIRAMTYVLITSAWYTSDNHLEELFCWVHPDHRNSDYSKLLIDFAKDCSDRISTEMGSKCPLVMGILTNKRTEAKVRLYRRSFGMPVGAYFAHNICWEQGESSDEDFWRKPEVKFELKQAIRRVQRREQRHNERKVG